MPSSVLFVVHNFEVSSIAVNLKIILAIIVFLYCPQKKIIYIEERLNYFFLQTHQQKFTVNKKADRAMWQYLVRGDSTQIASSTYTVSLDSLEFVYPFVYISYGSINDQYTACKYLSSTYSRMFDCPNGGFVSEYTVLNKGEVLSSTGVKATLFLFGSKHVVAAYSDLYMVSDLALDNEKGTLLIVTYDPLQNRNGCYITINQNTCAFVRAFKAKKTQELIPTNGEQPVRCHYYQQNDLVSHGL
ncbi:hypothetical protein FB192DRAFT_1344196 [Mucor lusitanicus]|uniref:Uncharacterized protein n=2 Tax=Mucor circinelloides f. lusitanicus TaxID=29924 RepID=A0A168J026_MUCCL|nr:hypothetical protein FB192DRAFT_1344196 [Mucor lusitanicus]OAD00576.1 hypothetical protein MUCCIDRAFT_166350 [Mucor lusitanicus CBS 277.49]